MDGMKEKRRLARIADAADYSATSRSTLYRAITGGELTAIKLGGALRFEYSELDRWIDAKSVIINKK